MARRATFYNDSKTNADLRLIVDSGAFSRGVGEVGKIRNKYMAKALTMLGYDVVNLSVRDMNNGGNFIKKLAKDNDLKFVSANIFYKDTNKLFTKPYEIVTLTRDGKIKGWRKIKVGVLGVCDERESLFSETLGEQMLESRSPVEAAKKWVPKLRSKCDLVVLLAHMNNNNLQQLIKEVKDVDVISVGGGYYRASANANRDSVIIVKTQSLGKYVGQLMLKIDGNKHIISHTATTIALTEKISDDPKMAAVVTEAEKVEKEFRKNRRAKTTAVKWDPNKKGQN